MSLDERPWVICVDDEVTNLKVFEANFRDRFRLKTFSNSPEALQFVRENALEIGVLIADQRMPDMTGVELLAKVRELAPDGQRMMLTAFADHRAMADAVNLGQLNRYFGKPWAKEELSNAIEDGLRIFTLTGEMRRVHARMVQSERLATLGQVSAGIAHELTNPVSYLTQNLTSLRADLVALRNELEPVLAKHPAQEVTRTLDDLPALVEDLERGVNHVREVAEGIKRHARGGEDDVGPTDVAQAVSFAVKLARSEVRQRARIATDSEPLMVRGSQVKLCQVLLNLIFNAAHAIEGRPGLIEVRWGKAEGGAVVRVIDNGSGISAAHLTKVFDRYFTTKAPGVGTGLGLAICKEQVESMGGSISISSEVGTGTTVEITLLAP